MYSQQIPVDVPTAVMYGTHMTAEETHAFINKTMAVEYYLNQGVSICYCAQIAGMTEEDFIKFLGQKGILIFHFDDKQKFLDEMM